MQGNGLISSVNYKTTSSIFKKAGIEKLWAGLTVIFTWVLTNAITENHSLDFLGFIFGVGVYFWYTGETEYRLDKDGIHKQVKPWLRYKYNNFVFDKFFSWNEIKSYKTGSYHASRIITFPLRLTKYLEINLPKGECWRITDDGYNDEFLIFQNEFIKVIEERNSRVQNHEIINRNKTLFENTWVRVCIWTFCILSLGSIIFFIIFPKYANWGLVSNIELPIVILGVLGWFYFRNIK
ncbi:MAG: hypothetical protein ACKVQB_05535 [Bacteroidia bacterium]